MDNNVEKRSGQKGDGSSRGKEERKKHSRPPYEECISSTSSCINHRILYCIRKVVSDFRSATGQGTKDNNCSDLSDEQNEAAVQEGRIMKKKIDVNSMIRLYDVFGTLEENRLHPGGWDNLRFMHSSGSDAIEGRVGESYVDNGCQCMHCTEQATTKLPKAKRTRRGGDEGERKGKGKSIDVSKGNK